MGTVGGFEKPLVEKSGVHLDSVDEVQAGALHGVGLLKALQGAFLTLVGTVQALGILGRRKPQVVLMTGGWVGGPVALAAWLRRIPVAIFLPDIEPALSIKLLRPLARKIAATTPESGAYVSARKLVVTGYPLRRSFTHMPAPSSLGEEQLATGDYPSFAAVGTSNGTALHVPVTRAAGIAHFKLDRAKKTLLVFGGSRGARSINIAIIDALPELLGRGDLQIIHVTGELDAGRGQSVTAEGYHPYAYLHNDMGLAMAAADLCVCRSGASTLGELPHFGLPSILVPYPFAWRYQKVNADFLAAHGAAQVLPDEQMAAALANTIHRLLDDNGKLAAMRAAARMLDRPHAALAIGEMLKSIAKGSQSV